MEQLRGQPVYTVSNICYKADFADICQALPKLPTGSRCTLDRGEYLEPFTVTQRLRLDGNGKADTRIGPITVADGGHLQLSGASVRGVVHVECGGRLELTNVDLTRCDPFACLRCLGDVALRECDVGELPECIEVLGGSLLLQSCTVRGAPAGRAAVVADGGGRVRMLSSAIKAGRARSCVVAAKGARVHAERCVFDGFTQIGVLVSGGGECTLLRNHFCGGARAVLISGGCTGTVAGNDMGSGTAERVDIRGDCDVRCSDNRNVAEVP
eukprot:TRINITY_DN47319_c0_g1_i1.p2 TRINITY_DN47319_c0_g1~~TRINITY_DN47319_c0_g1_i1.p2  ORF type:complete len:296 (+),score=84.68 TRINITY_DN47319_c0_g1_i1:82-888(+)